MHKIVKSDLAKLDLIEIADWMHWNAGMNLSAKFLNAAEKTFLLLAASPFIGSRCEFGPSDVSDLRKFRIDKFSKYLIFYTHSEVDLKIIRVLHGARDLTAIFSKTQE